MRLVLRCVPPLDSEAFGWSSSIRNDARSYALVLGFYDRLLKS